MDDKLSDRLRGMLLETASSTKNNDGAQRRRPLIQVVNSSDEEVKPKLLADQNVVKVNEDEEDEDECPPPISFSIGAAAVSKTTDRVIYV